MDEREERERAARRQFIRTHHPDVGGDSAHFVAGLQRWQDIPDLEAPARVVAVSTSAWPRRLVGGVRRAMRDRHRRPRVR